MKSLTARLVASYIALAVLTLAGAGLLLDRFLFASMVELDLQEARSQLDGASRIVGLMLMFNPQRTPQELESEVRKSYPTVRVESISAISTEEMLSLFEGRTDPQPLISDSSYRLPPMAAKLYRIPGQPSVRVIQVEEWNVVKLAVKVTWTDPVAYRVEAVRQALSVASILALVAAVLLAVWLGRTVAAPLTRITVAAERLAEGEWAVTLPTTGPTEVTRLVTAFRSMAHRLAEDFGRLRSDREHLKRLTAELGHELKTPLASLRAYHELLLDGEQENPATRQELLERGAAQVARLQYLSQGLLDMARLEASAVPLNLAEADMVDLVTHAAATVAPLAQGRGVQVAVEVPEAGVPALVDRHRIGQALDNLLTNALHFSSPGGRVWLRLRQTERESVIDVEDEGPGIAPNMMPRLFTPFAKGEGSNGLGLGLAVVRAVAQSHGGSVEAGNRPERGARFTLRIPAVGGHTTA